MRAHIVAAVLGVVLIGAFLLGHWTQGQPAHCPVSAQSVETLFAPCVAQQEREKFEIAELR
jgi:hypothetical protein